LQIKTKIVSCYTADSKLVQQEVNGTVILSPLVFPAAAFEKSATADNERKEFQHFSQMAHCRVGALTINFFP
jgi:hypothetical protein